MLVPEMQLKKKTASFFFLLFVYLFFLQENMTANKEIINNSPFNTYDSDQDPIAIAARAQQAQRVQKLPGIRWRYCTEPVNEIQVEHDPHQPEVNLIVLGRTGDGKSSLLNDFMGKQVFKQKISAKVNM